ncbi:MAG: radical SAM protein [Thermoplasmatales archaeon]|nr:radical SAM protein [Thermoplasmatales archaeon]
MKIREVKCKTALSKSNLPGLDYSLNPYRGCQHACAYCYVPNVLRIKRNEWGSFVDVKTNIPNVLSKELRTKKPGAVGISTVTDPYQPIEKKYKLTRYCLEQLLRYDFPVCIQTKSDLILRDQDLISKFPKVEVMMSIGTLNDEERKMLEPKTSSIQNRLDVLQQYSDIGIETSVFFGPIYPTIKTSDIPTIIDTFIEYGATEIMVDKLNLKPGIKENVTRVFLPYKNLIENVTYHQQLFHEIMRVCKEKNMKAVYAF